MTVVAPRAPVAVRLNPVVLPGDGVGPEVTAAAMDVLAVVAERFGHSLDPVSHDIGWVASVTHGVSLPEATLEACVSARAVVLGAVGDPRAEGAPAERRPEAALLALRKALGCFANLRPIKVDDALLDVSAVRRDLVEGTDILIVRELIGGIYFGEPRGRKDGPGGVMAFDTMAYDQEEIRRIARVAFEAAGERQGRLTSIDKANVLESSRLWRETVTAMSPEYPEVSLSHMLVDRAAMELITRSRDFDVILAPNLFGDVLSDEGAALTGSMGVLASASIGGRTGLYEPVHGSAPDLAGRDLANPIGAIRSAGLMLRHTYGLSHEANAVDAAIADVLSSGLRTPDLEAPGTRVVGTGAFGRAVAQALSNPHPDRQS